jgi:hypothetical protein
VRWSDWASNWIAGFGVGGFVGILVGGLPILGLLLVVAFLVPAMRSHAPIAAVAGLLIGGPLMWVVILGRAVLACNEFDAQPGQECIGPDLTAWFVAASILLTAGVLLTWRAARAAR